MFHTEIRDAWLKYSIFEQMANIGAEVGRVLSWKRKANEKQSQNALFRALELIDMTVRDPKNTPSLKELLRMREILVDYTIGDNIYLSTDDAWERYFYYFNLAARR